MESFTDACPTLTKPTSSGNTFSSTLSGFTGTINDLGFLITTDESWVTTDTVRASNVTLPFEADGTDLSFSKDTALTIVGLVYHIRPFVKISPTTSCSQEYVFGDTLQFRHSSSTAIQLLDPTMDSVCAGTSVTLIAHDGYDSYVWSNEMEGQTINVTPNSTTVYTVTMTNSNGTVVESRAVTVMSHPVIIYADSVAPNTLEFYLLDNLEGANYVWNKNGTVISLAITNRYIDNNVVFTAAMNSSDYYGVSVTLGNCTLRDSVPVKWVANAVRKCDGATVKDYEGNVYNTVVIGDLCWTRENMRATKYYNATTHSYVDITDGSSQELYPSIPYRYNS
jgi:hypothetical protein